MKFLSYLLSFITVMGCSFALVSCGSDEEPDYNIEKFSSYDFTLTISDYGDDQQDVIITMVQYTDYLGNKITDTFDKQEDDTYTIKSHAFTKIPAQGDITIFESVKGSYDFNKASFQLGLRMNLKLTSYSTYNRELSSVTSERVVSGSYTPAGLSKVYPRTTTFRYNVDKNGNVSISSL